MAADETHPLSLGYVGSFGDRDSDKAVDSVDADVFQRLSKDIHAGNLFREMGLRFLRGCRRCIDVFSVVLHKKIAENRIVYMFGVIIH